MPASFDKNTLLDAIAKFPSRRILVLGDVMLDEFIWGKVRRISPEAPVPVVEVERQSHMLGGAANVLHNLIALGGDTRLCGLIGRDRAGGNLTDLLDQLEVNTGGLIACPARPTTIKTRVVAHSQQVVRVDTESRRQVNPEELAGVASYIEKCFGEKLDAIIVSDYAKGMICQELMDKVLRLAAAHGAPVLVDPKVANMPLYAGATLVTPNHLEATQAAGIELDAENSATLAGKKLLAQYGFDYVLVTKGREGMSLFRKGQEDGIHISTTAKRVFDVTGAGDTVISTLSLGMAAGLNPGQAAYLANLAAGIVVGEVGTSVVTARQLALALEEADEHLSKGN